MKQVLQSGHQRTIASWSNLEMQLVSQMGIVKIIKRSHPPEAREAASQQAGLAGQAGTSLERKASAESQGRMH